MGKGTGRERAARIRMWNRDPHCSICGVETFLPEQASALVGMPPSKIPPMRALLRRGLLNRMATIDHVISKHDPRRPHPEPGERRWRLACYGCNNKLAREQDLAMPIEERWRRSGRAPQTTEARK